MIQAGSRAGIKRHVLEGIRPSLRGASRVLRLSVVQGDDAWVSAQLWCLSTEGCDTQLFLPHLFKICVCVHVLSLNSFTLLSRKKKGFYTALITLTIYVFKLDKLIQNFQNSFIGINFWFLCRPIYMCTFQGGLICV